MNDIPELIEVAYGLDRRPFHRGSGEVYCAMWFTFFHII
jgi:hypothetical protein